MFPVQQELPLGHPTQHASVVLPVVAAASAILLLPSSQVKSEHSCPATHSRVSQITSAGLCAYLALSLALARPLQKKRKVTVAPCVDATKHAAPTKRSTLLRRDITRRPVPHRRLSATERHPGSLHPLSSKWSAPCVHLLRSLDRLNCGVTARNARGSRALGARSVRPSAGSVAPGGNDWAKEWVNAKSRTNRDCTSSE